MKKNVSFTTKIYTQDQIFYYNEECRKKLALCFDEKNKTDLHDY